ncbi:MAG: hypothetical protein BM564_06200 [Bacteroidetes bacterium MedPE-SWsnd-G2]|nr:MAG: hypothetical protein BM564_06200 [Bacteroidetes bacterium MedPE-SWsnd-G2]
MSNRIIVFCFTLLFSISFCGPSFVSTFDCNYVITIDLEPNDKESSETNNSNLDELFYETKDSDFITSERSLLAYIPYSTNFYQNLQLECTNPPPDLI